jgi:hypothetical protein
MLLNLEEYMLAAVQTFADKIKVAAVHSNKIILIKQDYEVLGLAKQQANQSVNVDKAPIITLKQALSHEQSSYSEASQTNSLTDKDVDLIACLEQLKYSTHYNRSPQFLNVLQVINDPNFINEDKDKDHKDLFYKQIVELITKQLVAVLTPEQAQVLNLTKFKLGTSYCLANMVTDSLITLLKYDLTKRIAEKFLTSDQLKDFFASLAPHFQSIDRISELKRKLTVYSAQV